MKFNKVTIQLLTNFVSSLLDHTRAGNIDDDIWQVEATFSTRVVELSAFDKQVIIQVDSKNYDTVYVLYIKGDKIVIDDPSTQIYQDIAAIVTIEQKRSERVSLSNSAIEFINYCEMYLQGLSSSSSDKDDTTKDDTTCSCNKDTKSTGSTRKDCPIDVLHELTKIFVDPTFGKVIN